MTPLTEQRMTESLHCYGLTVAAQQICAHWHACGPTHGFEEYLAQLETVLEQGARIRQEGKDLRARIQTQELRRAPWSKWWWQWVAARRVRVVNAFGEIVG
jgi:hypothetical protein